MTTFMCLFCAVLSNKRAELWFYASSNTLLFLLQLINRNENYVIKHSVSPLGMRQDKRSPWCKLFLHAVSQWHMTASPKPSFRAPCTVVSRGNAGWTASKSGHPCLCQNCSHGPPAENNWKRISAELTLMYPQWSNQSRDWTELTVNAWVLPCLVLVD